MAHKNFKKRYDNKFFSTPVFYCCFWIRDPGWVKIISGSGIRDKHPGSATLDYPVWRLHKLEISCVCERISSLKKRVPSTQFRVK
jgi:hypothetical protein